MAMSGTRYNIKLKEPNDDSYSEFSYFYLSDYKNEDEPNGCIVIDNIDVDYATIEKLNQKNKKRKLYEEDLVDLTDGYDIDDPFIDDTEVFDEQLPYWLTTDRGGFYINKGILNFKRVNRDESTQINVMPDLQLIDKEKNKIKQKPKKICIDDTECDDALKAAIAFVKPEDTDVVEVMKKLPISYSAVDTKELETVILQLINYSENFEESVNTLFWAWISKFLRSKKYLINKMCIQNGESKLKKLISLLHCQIDSQMPLSIKNYQENVQNFKSMTMKNLENSNDKICGTSMVSIPLYKPKMIFVFTPEIILLMRRIVSEKLSHVKYYSICINNKDDAIQYIKNFFKVSIKHLWSKGWISATIFLRKVSVVFSKYSNKPENKIKFHTESKPNQRILQTGVSDTQSIMVATNNVDIDHGYSKEYHDKLKTNTFMNLANTIPTPITKIPSLIQLSLESNPISSIKENLVSTVNDINLDSITTKNIQPGVEMFFENTDPVIISDNSQDEANNLQSQSLFSG
ncbi:hypothetical protein A3Q56_04316 [Intoshia linei]|uniref:Hpc2-related domain-containing protein n=1 Tax=Intoshia linei TaxID=1819745 RepID=A0A177B2Z2_9BILA|nr:hypothetical protein A3Q56_04316 [Intoshia linei]